MEKLSDAYVFDLQKACDESVVTDTKLSALQTRPWSMPHAVFKHITSYQLTTRLLLLVDLT